jgi:hypothetical protein
MEMVCTLPKDACLRQQHACSINRDGREQYQAIQIIYLAYYPTSHVVLADAQHSRAGVLWIERPLKAQ